MKEFKFKIDGQEYAAQVEEQESGVQVTVNGKAYNVEVEQEEHHVARPVQRVAVAAAPKAAAGSAAKISAPLPGNITKILVSAGAKVKKGEVIMTMEAMKMENNISAEFDCTVKNIVAQVGQSVNQGDVLAEVISDAAPAAAPAPKAAPAAPKAAPAAPVAAPKAAAPAGGKAVTAPLPGTVTKVNVSVGQEIKKGDVVLVMEAMKMANDIVSEWDGKVAAVNVQQGASVNVGDALVVIG